MVALESTTLSLAKTIVQKAAAAWIADRRTAKEGKKELRALLTPRFPHAAPEQRFLDEAAAELASLGRYEFRGLDDGDREAALLAVRDAFTRADLTDRTLFAVDVDAVKLASRLRAGQPRAKTAAGLGEVGAAFYDAALDRCCELYVRAVVQVPAFAGRSLAEMLNRVSDLPDQVAARVVNAWREAQAAVADQPDSDVTMAGWLLEEVTDPFVLEVHRPVQLADAPSGLPVLPPYEKRDHDQVLGQVVRAAADGHSGIAVLVGESSTGKTRACWETLALLRDQDPPWRLWHPIDPSRPDAALRELPGIGPRTVVWLNEAQFYLDTADELGEQVAAGLRALLRDPARGPVLVLATLWPEYWHSLTARPVGGADRHPDARELLDGHDITVPPAFTSAQMSQLALAADARMALAARSAPDGEVIQFLAGAPELLARYRNAPPAAAALISAAMDARRLGMGAGLPRAFLEAAAPGYLTDAQWDALGEDWLEQALAYAAVPCKGARGPLTRIRPRPASRAACDRGDQPAGMATAAGSLYRLADYLDQHGRAHRASQFPPAEFWSAAATHALPGDQAALGDAAHDRGLYRDAAQLHKNAAASGNPRALIYLSHPPAYLPAAPGPAQWVTAHAPLDKPTTVSFLLGSLREAGAHEQAAALASRAAAHTPLDNPGGVASLLEGLRRAGAHEQATALLDRDPAAHASLDNPGGVASLLESLRRAGARKQTAGLADRAAAHTPLADPGGVAYLLDSLREAGAHEQAAALASRAAAHTPLADPGGVASLLEGLRRAGAHEQATALLDRDPAAHAAVADPGGVASLLDSLRRADAHEQVAALASRAATLDEPYAVSRLLDSLHEAGAHEQATMLASRASIHTPLDNPGGVASLLDSLRRAGAHEQAAALARRAAAHTPLHNPGSVAHLLDSLRAAGTHEQATALLARDPVAHATLQNPGGVARLLDSLRRAGAHEQATALLARDPVAHATLRNPSALASLLDSLHAAGAHEQAAALARRAAAHTPLHNPGRVASLLDSLHEAGAHKQATVLLARDPVAHTAHENPYRVARLLDSLRRAGAHEQGAALASRAAAHTPLDDPRGVASLLDSLHAAGAHEQAATLVGRLPAVGMFELLEQRGLTDQFRFGREADGIPAAPWGWEDLDLWLVPDREDREATLPVGLPPAH